MKVFSLAVSFCGLLFLVEGKSKILPYSGFKWELEQTKDECKKIPGFKVEADKKYEGRWYGVYSGLKNKVKCVVWDSYHDEDGTRYDFYLVEDDGLTTMTVVNTPKSNGTYTFNGGQDTRISDIYSTNYYVDDKILVRYEIECFKNEKKVGHDIVVAVRDLKDLAAKKAEIDATVKKLQEAGAKGQFKEIKHKNCKYPPVKKNPFAE